MEELEFEEKRIKLSDNMTAARGTLNAQNGILAAIQQVPASRAILHHAC